MFKLFKILVLFFLCVTALQAEKVYKSIDENGRVSYSSTPPDDNQSAEKIDIAPPPSDAEIQAAKQRHEKNLEAAETMDTTRKKRNEITAEENRIKSERQKQMQKQTQQKEQSNSPAYPYYYPRYPGVTVPPNRPVIDRPIIERPVQLPAR